MSDKVLIKRELLERLADIAEIEGQPEGAQARALLTAQPQAAPDEAVAQWQSMSCGEGGRWFNIADSDAEQAKSDGFEVRALYTHPAPSQPSGRVELSRQFVDAVKQLCKDFSDLQNRPYMGDVYAALDGLLEHEQIPVAATPHPEQPQACAAQSAPAGEREALERELLSVLDFSESNLQRVVDHLLGAGYSRAAWQRTQSAVGAEGYALLSKALELLRGVHTGELFGPDGWETVNAFLSENQHFAHPQVAPVMPDVSAMARVLSDRSADACNIDRTDNWAMYGQEYIEDVQAMLAAPAQPAAQGSAVPALTEKEREDLLEFHEAVCCDAGHRVEKDGMRRLAEIGAVESVGFGKHRLTEFGVYLLGIAPKAAQDQGEVQRLPGRWVPFSERWPEPNAALDDPAVKSMPRVLVTNNFKARDRMGRMSHVWYGAPMKNNDGQVITFTESDSRIYGLTHWFEIDLLAASTGQEVEP